MKLAIFVAAAFAICALEARAQDTDGDGVADPRDNCLVAANPRQLDPDLDGYGNSCDGDFDQDGDTDQADWDFYSFNCPGGFPIDPDICDLNENGLSDFGDPALMAALMGSPPGPSGLACAGTVPCTAPPAVPALDGAGMAALLLALVASALAMRRRWRVA